MAEPNYAYNPAVASWVQSMSLAGIEEQDLDLDLDEQPHQSHHNHPNHHQYSHTHNHHNNHHQDDTPDSPSPDDYYKSAYTPAPEHDFAAPPADMNVTRQRQNTAGSNSVRSPIRGGPRSVSGPASSIASSRSPPQASNKVKALAERFERSPGGAARSSTFAKSSARVSMSSRSPSPRGSVPLFVCRKSIG